MLAVQRAIKIHGYDNPIVQECLSILVCIARAYDGYRGRYIGERLRAANRLLDTLLGKPREMQPAEGDAKSAIRSLIDRIESGEFEDQDKPEDESEPEYDGNGSS